MASAKRPLAPSDLESKVAFCIFQAKLQFLSVCIKQQAWQCMQTLWIRNETFFLQLVT